MWCSLIQSVDSYKESFHVAVVFANRRQVSSLAASLRRYRSYTHTDHCNSDAPNLSQRSVNFRKLSDSRPPNQNESPAITNMSQATPRSRACAAEYVESPI